MKTFLCCSLLLGGSLLIYLGLNASTSIGPALFRLRNCTAADRTIWMLVVGMVAMAGGVGGLLHRSSSALITRTS